MFIKLPSKNPINILALQTWCRNSKVTSSIFTPAKKLRLKDPFESLNVGLRPAGPPLKTCPHFSLGQLSPLDPNGCGNRIKLSIGDADNNGEILPQGRIFYISYMNSIISIQAAVELQLHASF